MTEQEMKSLQDGDIVRHVDSGTAYIVTANLGDMLIGVRTVTITRPDEWVAVRQHSQQPSARKNKSDNQGTYAQVRRNLGITFRGGVRT